MVRHGLNAVRVRTLLWEEDMRNGGGVDIVKLVKRQLFY